MMHSLNVDTLLIKLTATLTVYSLSNFRVYVAESPDWKRIGKLQHPKAAEVCFSPSGNFLAVWDMFMRKFLALRERDYV